MMRKTVAAILCLMLFSVSTYALAENVYVTKKGKKYHTQDCRLIKKSKLTEMTEDEAIAKGLKPCGVCMKEKAESVKAMDAKADELSKLESKK